MSVSHFFPNTGLILVGTAKLTSLHDIAAQMENLQGHPPELSDSVKLLLSDARRHVFEIGHVLKSMD